MQDKTFKWHRIAFEKALISGFSTGSATEGKIGDRLRPGDHHLCFFIGMVSLYWDERPFNLDRLLQLVNYTWEP